MLTDNDEKQSLDVDMNETVTASHQHHHHVVFSVVNTPPVIHIKLVSTQPLLIAQRQHHTVSYHLIRHISIFCSIYCKHVLPVDRIPLLTLFLRLAAWLSG